LKIDKNSAHIDTEKVKAESRFDGKWVLQTNTDLPADQAALKYKELWQVERVFRDIKSLLETRPVFHQCDNTIKGHVFCSFLALILKKELDRRLNDDKRFSVRTECKGNCGKIFQAVGVAVPPAIREL